MHSSLIIAGSLASDVALETDEAGASVARFRVIMHSRRKDPATGLWSPVPPTVLSVVCRRRLAHNVAESLRHRDPVVVGGRLRICDTGRRPYLEIDAWAVGPDLTRTRAQVLRSDVAA
ncbi:MAG TPA: single-stranded DNA-binding protein [Actinomycetota bacterium]|jgi:single-stranded DNA-binding protein|nr:single-stranded DNA-binding protein [Actinomycetota bacterium]HNL52120.1 single-stranded DNA-binding protein [Actinomycetota bacterium]HNO16171.1 single-stranded DNA-binding protein [Actinomycetota bacterium]HUM87255.1 single-stranded DNA-binding protein [Actinomycetota bacterium]